MGCSKFWANNEGGLWCWEYRPELPEGACDNCPECNNKEEAHDASNDHKHQRTASGRA